MMTMNMRALILHFALPLFLICFSNLNNVAFGDTQSMAPNISPTPSPQPFLPLLGPSPMTALINDTEPTLSGLCQLNFTSIETIMSKTAIDCFGDFAPYLSNVICCPQFDASLLSLIGQSSQSTGTLALDTKHSSYCLSDVEKILTSKGANPNLRKICSIGPENLTQSSCPVASIDTFESLVDSSTLVSACEKIDKVNECCKKSCYNAIFVAAQKLALTYTSSLSTEEKSKMVGDCKKIVLRWLASKLDPLSSNDVFRVLSNCEINQDCPLVFPNATNVVEVCGNVIRNRSICCESVSEYMFKLQEQIFITNVQALNCAASLGIKLQKENVTQNIYDVCHININKFSLQVGSQEFGCLLPSSPSDVTLDRESGISFNCDLNDNIAASWPSSASPQPFSFCNKTTKIPALPKATSAQNGFYGKNLKLHLLFSLAFIKMFL